MSDSVSSPIKTKRERVFAVLPTLMTLGNAFCGFAAITYAAKVGPDAAEAAGGHLLTAAVYIYLAMVFDALDGRVARWANQTSEFGAQLDSLCDAVSFGCAPAFLMLQFAEYSSGFHARVQWNLFHPRVLWVIGALYVVCALLRLARFNVETDEDDSHNFFSGLPSPAAAGAVASFPIAMLEIKKLVQPDDADIPEFAHLVGEFLHDNAGKVLPLVTFAVACLMVSRIRYSHVFNQLFSGKRGRGHLIQLVFTVAVVFIVRELAVPLIFCYFAFASPLRAAWTSWIVPRFRRTPSPNTPATTSGD